MGFRTPNDEEQYVLQCCGYELTLDDDETYLRVIAELKQYYGLHDEPT